MRQQKRQGTGSDQWSDTSVKRSATGAPGKSTLVERAYGSAVQQRAGSGGDGAHPAQVHAEAERGVAGAGAPLPHLDTIQRLFGPSHDLRGVQAHTDGEAASACHAIGASAYATGNHVAFAGPPSLHTAAHEAAHVVQQRGGVQLLGGVGQAGDEHERHADQVADAVVAGKSAEALLGKAAPATDPAGARDEQGGKAACPECGKRDCECAKSSPSPAAAGGPVQRTLGDGHDLTSPYAFASYDHVYRVQDGAVGKEVARRVLEKTGVRYLAYGNIGFRHTLTVAKPVRTPADFAGLKIRVPPSPAFVSAFKLLGANTTPIPGGEMYTALKTGVVDGVEGAPDILLDFKMFEVAKNYSLTGHIYTDIPLVIADRLWKAMTPERQKAFTDAARAAELYERELIKREEGAMFDNLRKAGVTIVKVDTAPMRAKMTPYYDEFAKRIGGRALIDQTLGAAK